MGYGDPARARPSSGAPAGLVGSNARFDIDAATCATATGEPLELAYVVDVLLADSS
ncbi:MAG TPA: hypothetical protein VF094_07565 [Gaiellaceae bacterium]